MLLDSHSLTLCAQFLQLDFALDRGVEAIRLVTSEGLDKAVSTWNQVRKSKLSKMRYSNIEAN